MTTKIALSRITIDIPAVDHKKLKALAALHDKSMREIIIELIEEHLGCDKSHVPNKKTQKAIEDSGKSKNILRAVDAKDLFKKLGI